MIIITVGLAFAPIPSASRDLPVDVIAWFKGCVALVQGDTSAADVMDIQCVADATDYCGIGRVEEDRGPCVEELAQELDTITAALIANKPDVSSLTGFGPRSFELHWNLAEQKDHAHACTGALRPPERCAAYTAMRRWKSARTAWRTWRRYQP
ncbi:MAG: hypothetical protein AAFZ14_00405 [Pseudomonadota bacterium]